MIKKKTTFYFCTHNTTYTLYKEKTQLFLDTTVISAIFPTFIYIQQGVGSSEWNSSKTMILLIN